MNDEPEALLAVIRDTGAMYYKRRDALQKLARVDAARARPALLEALIDPEKVLRREAAKLLGAHADAAVCKALVGALADGDSDVRRNAARALKETGATQALDALRLAAEKDESIFVRREAEESVKVLEAQAPSPAPKEPPSTPAAPPVPDWRKTRPEPSAPKAPEPKRESPSGFRSGTLPPWKRKTPDTDVKPSLKHFKAASAGRPIGPIKTRPEKKPKAPTKIVLKKLREKIPVARLESRSRRPSAAPLPPPIPVPGIEKITRKVRKAVASRAVGAQLCPKCQWVVKPGQRYCTFCGHPMSPAASRTEAPARPVLIRADTPRSTTRAPRRPRPPVRSGSPAPFFKAGCIVAAALGFVFLLFIFICIAGSSDRSTNEPRPHSRSTLQDWNAQGATTESDQPGLDGPRVTVILTTGRTYRGNLLKKTPDHIRLKWKDKILRIQRRVVRKIVYQ